MIRGFSRQTTCIENREGFAVHLSTWPSGAKKASDVSAADWLYQHTWKKYDTFSRVLLRLFSGPEIPVEHRSLCAKVTYPFLIIV